MHPAALDRLAVASARGDEAAFTALIEATEQELRAFVCARAAHIGMVEEVVQAAYVTAFTQLVRYEPRGTLLSWLKGIARNRLSEELRRLRQVQPLPADLAERLISDDCSVQLERDGDDDDLPRLRACLEHLPERTRQVLFLRYSDDQPLTTLAERLGQPATNLAALLYRARKLLLACLDRRTT